MDADEFASAVRAARHGYGFVSGALVDRGGLDEPEAIRRVADALGVTQHVDWRRIAIEPNGRRLLAWAIGRSLMFRDELMPPAEAEVFVDRLFASVPDATVAVTNVGQFEEGFGLRSYDPLHNWLSGVALILVGPSHAGGIAIQEDD
ncbi:MAG: hypothetical protein ACYC65_10575 [Candidatus Limnocylindrales bacterium]